MMGAGDICDWIDLHRSTQFLLALKNFQISVNFQLFPSQMLCQFQIIYLDMTPFVTHNFFEISTIPMHIDRTAEQSLLTPIMAH